MQNRPSDLGTRQGTSVMEAMQKPTLFLGEETPPLKKDEPVRSPHLNSKYPLADLQVHAQRMFAKSIEIL